jgi:hypothetical protein
VEWVNCGAGWMLRWWACMTGAVYAVAGRSARPTRAKP